MRIERVSESVYADTSGDGNGNFGAIVLGRYIVAIDTSLFPTVVHPFRKYIEKETGKNVTTLILTHYHADHVFGNQVFKDCRIISSKELKEKMNEAAKTDWTPEGIEKFSREAPEVGDKLKDLEITFPTETFESRLTIKDGKNRINIEHIGGHTADSSYVYFPSEKILFSGDLIFAQRFPWGGDSTVDPEKWLRALKQLKKLKTDKIVPGHGPICDAKELAKYIDFFGKTTRIIKHIVSNGGSKEEAMSSKDYPEFYAPRRPEARQMTLSNWYDYYKGRL